MVQRLWPGTSPLWLDEAQTVAIADRPVGELLETLRLDGAPPLYYLLLHGWIELFGSADVAVRLLSGVLSVAGLPLAWWIGRQLTGRRRTGLLFVLVLAANPWTVRYAIETRMYALIQLLVLLGMVAAVLLVRRRTRRDTQVAVAAVTAVTAALLLTHYWSFFLVAVVGAWCLWRAARGRDRPTALLALGGMAGGGLLFLPWLPTLLHQIAHTGSPWAGRGDFGAIATLPVEWFGGSGPAGLTLALLAWPLMLLGAFGVADGRDSVRIDLGGRTSLVGRAAGAVTLATLLLGLVVSWLTGEGMVGRYTAVVVPLALLLVVLGLSALPARHAVRATAVLAAVGLLAGATIVTSQKTQAGEVAEALNIGATAGDVVIYCPDQLAVAVQRRLHAPRLVQLTRPAQPNPGIVDWTDYTERIERESHGPLLRRAVAASQQGRTVWLVTAPSSMYRTHAEDCPDLQSELVTRLGEPERVVEAAPNTYERAEVLRFGPTT